MVRPSPAPVPGPAPLPPAGAPVVPGSVSVETVMAWLDQVPDPEVPVLSVIDLGIVRAVAWEGETLAVTLTPTYSGCPATRVIEMMVRDALTARGIPSLRIETRISPPWTTDWISPKGRAALARYGIAPPEPAGGPKACPHCGSNRVVEVSRFGSTPCKAQWRCESCLEPFDYFKCI